MDINRGLSKKAEDEELRSDQLEDAIRRVHAIRGVAGNLGGKVIAAAASELENACH
jgi:HPt (histidine-containing phosphotransfer) domain-containing protein